MKKIIMVLTLTLFFLHIFAFDELWQKAQVIAENSWKLVPGITTLEMFTISENADNISAGMEIKMLHYLGEDGTIVTEVIKAEMTIDEGEMPEIEDDEDFFISEEDLAEFLIEDFHQPDDFDDAAIAMANEMSKDMIPKRSGMFFETNTRNLSVKRMNETKTINGRLCQGFEIRYSASGKRRDREEGTVWLEINTGAPVMAEMSPNSTPMFTRSINIETHYGFNDDTKQFFREKVINNAEISVLRIRMNMITTIMNENYWEFHM